MVTSRDLMKSFLLLAIMILAIGTYIIRTVVTVTDTKRVSSY